MMPEAMILAVYVIGSFTTLINENEILNKHEIRFPIMHGTDISHIWKCKFIDNAKYVVDLS